MSLRNHSLEEHIRDLAARPETDRAARDALGREVLSALEEIDRLASARPGAGPAAAAAITTQLAVVGSTLSPGMLTLAGIS